jgi:ankyrin repeat protein
MSDALEALYAGDVGKARDLLPPDDELSVYEAAAFGRLDALGRILDEDPAQATAFGEDGFTALHLAVFAEQEEAARILLERGADVHAVSAASIAQVPPLRTAAFVRSLPLARVLLDAGADPNSAVATARANGDEELLELLRERGARV